MKLKVVSGAQVKLFSTRKAQYLAQALTLGVTNASGPGISQPNFVSRNEQRDITALGRSLHGDIFVWKYCLRLFAFSSLNVYRGVLEAVLELMLCSQRSLRLILNLTINVAK